MHSPRRLTTRRVGWFPIAIGAVVLVIDLAVAFVIAGPASSSVPKWRASATEQAVTLPGIATGPIEQSPVDRQTPFDPGAPIPAATVPLPPVPGLPRPTEDVGATLATARIERGTINVWSEPDGSTPPSQSIPAPTEFGGERHFLVVQERDHWVEVQLPVRPNGSTGWLPRSAVTLAPVSQRMQIDLSERTVIVWDGDDVVLDTSAAVGADPSPTPTGSFYVRDVFPWNPDSIYGPWVLALSAYSESIQRINGGDAVIAIHGTRDDSVLGQAVSLGCIRLDNETVTQLAALVGPGTPVSIVP